MTQLGNKPARKRSFLESKVYVLTCPEVSSAGEPIHISDSFAEADALNVALRFLFPFQLYMENASPVIFYSRFLCYPTLFHISSFMKDSWKASKSTKLSSNTRLSWFIHYILWKVSFLKSATIFVNNFQPLVVHMNMQKACYSKGAIVCG